MEIKGRLAHRYEILSEFQFTIEYRPGSENTVPDILSRWDSTSSHLAHRPLLTTYQFSPKALDDISKWVENLATRKPSTRELPSSDPSPSSRPGSITVAPPVAQQTVRSTRETPRL